MATPQKPRKDLEFYLRTLSHHGGAAVRSVRPLYHSRPLGAEPAAQVTLRRTMIIPCSPSSFSAKYTMPLSKSAGRTSARPAVALSL
jgi:hypothetical protein